MSDVTKRPVEIVAEDNGIGSWHINCPTCPKHEHERIAEVKKLSACVSGIQTRMQGAIPLNHCQHKRNKDWHEPLQVECAFQYPKSQTV